MTAQNRQYSVVAVLADEADKVDTHLFEEFFFRDAQYLNRYKNKEELFFFLIKDLFPQVRVFSEGIINTLFSDQCVLIDRYFIIYLLRFFRQSRNERFTINLMYAETRLFHVCHTPNLLPPIFAVHFFYIL